jgi:hypothetical protein
MVSAVCLIQFDLQTFIVVEMLAQFVVQSLYDDTFLYCCLYGDIKILYAAYVSRNNVR